MAIEPGKELLWKYISGQCDPHEVAFVDSWIASDPENEKTLERLRMYKTITKSNGEKNDQESNEQESMEEEESILSTYLPAMILIFMIFILLTLYLVIKNA